MAEPGGQPLINNRILIGAVGGLVLIAVIFLLFSFRSCLGPASKDKGYQVIYSNLDLKDAANVVARLKEIGIVYEVRDKGSAVAVPKEKTDEARLGLAEKNLPLGGDVGWEIFDASRMGATDFDRRIQLVRAISGELARTIRRIEGVEDARIQVVLPENRLFEVTKAPVTSSVLIKMQPGRALAPEQINGIVHLVSSSVENLQPENVMVVDDSGNILSSKIKLAPPPAPEAMPLETLKEPEQNIIRQVELPPTPEAAAAAPVIPRELSAEEKSLLKIQAKDQYEKQLTAKIQDLLAIFYPAGSFNAQVAVYLGGDQEKNKINKLKIKTLSGVFAVPIRQIKVMIFIDQKLTLTEELKKNTFSTLADVIPYNKARGDKIIIKSIYFEKPLVPQVFKEAEPEKKTSRFSWPNIPAILIALLIIALIVVMLRYFTGRKKPLPPFEAERGELMVSKEPEFTQAGLDQIKEIAQHNPERVAAMLKKWLTEEA